MTPEQRDILIRQYRDGFQAVVDTLEGMSNEELDLRITDVDWTIREVIHHLADSEMTSAIRLRRLLIEDRPEIIGYDQEAFARGLHYADRPIEPALKALHAARWTTNQILERMAEVDWQ